MTVVALGNAPAAHAEVGDSSNSSAQFLSGSLLGTNTGNVAGIDGAQASYVDGRNTTPVVDDAALDVTALSAIALPSLPNNVTLGDLLNLGVVTQHAEADAAGVSSANSSTADASLDLLALTGGPTAVLSAGTLDLGAISSSASLTGATDVTRDYSVANANLNLTSPTVAGITTTTTNATGTLVNTLNGLSTPIQNAVNSSVGTIINTIGGITGTANTNTTVNVDASRLNTAIQGVLAQPLSTDLVTIDPSTGQITVNLANGIDLNNLPPNSTLLSPQVMQQVSADVATLLGQLQTNVNNILNNATSYVDISLNSHTTITAGITLGTMDLTYNGTLRNFLAGAPITVAGTGVLAPATALGTLSSIVENAVGTAVNTAITTAVNTAGQAVNTVVTNATNALAPALTGIADVVAVNLNVQTDNPNGSYSETAVQVQLLGGSGATLNLATSTVGPNVRTAYSPTLSATSPASAGDSTTVSGGGWPPNTTVTLQITDPAGDPVGDPVTVTTDDNGNIPDGTTIPIPADTPPGTGYTVTGTTAEGLTATAPLEVVDTTAPDAPVIQTPADGSTTNDTTPTVSGTGEPGATVHVQIDGTDVGDATVAADGTWTLDLTTPLADGQHTVSATQTDPSGNTSPAASNDFTVDTTAPDAPTITSPADGSTTNDSTPDITGTAEPNATVTVTVGGQTLTTTADANGDWTVTPTALADGPYTITATQTDAAGNESPAATSDFTVDTTAPDAPVITGPADGSTIGTGVDTVTGTAEPNATVDVTVDGVAYQVVADASGAWTLTLPEPFAEGDHTVTATQTDEAGNTSPTATSNFTVDASEPAPVITGPVSGTVTNDATPDITGTGTPGDTLTVRDQDGNVIGTTTVAPDGSWTVTPTTPLPDGTYTFTATQTDSLGNESPQSNSTIVTIDTTAPDAPVITSPVDGSTTSDTTPTISGTGEPGATVTVTVDGNTIGTATVDPNGNWTLDSPALADGPHTVTATQIDPAGNESAPSDPVTFTVDTTAPDAPTITSPADGSTTGDNTPEITGNAEPGSTVEVFVDGVSIGTTTADPTDGSWSITPTDPLADGDHTVTATATDGSGNTSPTSDPVTFTVDTTAAPPVITSPADGSTTADNTPAITGTAEPGATVEVTVDGTVIGTTTADANGDWTFTPTTPLADGSHTVTATQTDPSGNTSDASAPVTFTVDTTQAAPVITSPSDGSVTSDNTPTITGTAEPGSSIEVFIDGNSIGTTTADANGSWILDVPTALADGSYTATATSTDASGNTSAPSDPVTFTIDTTAPDAPVITSPADGTTTGDNTPDISGTGEPGASLTVTDQNGNIIGTTTVNPDGTWTITPTDPLPEGDTTLTATQTDPAGNTSDPSDPVTITVDTTAPDAPVITSPADQSTTADSTPDITGTAEPGSTVEVIVDGVSIGTTTADANGSWTLTPTTPLSDGQHTVTATATDPNGNTSPESDPVTFTVDTTAPDAPVITSPSDGSTTGDNTPTITGTAEPGATVTVSVDGTEIGTTTAGADGSWSVTPTDPLDDGDHTVTATATDPAGNESAPSEPVTFTIDTTAPDAPVITSPADGTTTADNTPDISGTGEPGASLTVTDQDGNIIGTTTVAPDGTWTITPTDPLPEGDTTLTATQTDPAGNTSDPSDPVTITVDTTAPDAPVITSPADQSTTADSTPAITGTAEPGATVEVFVDGTSIGTTTADANGDWTLTPTAPLSDGQHTVTATATDPSGNTSPESDPVTFTVDTTAPDAPVITSPSNGSTTGDNTPTITGTAEPGAEVIVTVDGNEIGPVTAGADGTWSITPTDPLDDGDHTVTATATDPYGNTSAPSAPVTFTVDTTAPDAPTITGPADGSTVNDSTPDITGTGEPGATVTVTDADGNVIGTATVDADGMWTVTPTDPLPEGENTITATQTDPAGNTSDPSDPVTFTVDTTVDAPVITSPDGGTSTNDNTPTISGTGTPGDTVTVKDQNGNTIGDAVVGADGSWTVTPTTPLDDGTYTFTATQSDSAGNTSPASNSVIVTIDTTAPAAPTVTSPTDGSSTSDPTPTISGTGEPGDTVTVTVDGNPIGTTTVDPSGSWSLTPTDPLAEGDHTVTATQTDPAGNNSPASDPVTFTENPASPVITSPGDGDTVDQTPVVSGTGTPGDTVTVYVDGDPAGTATVGSGGHWSVPLDPMGCGDHVITARQAADTATSGGGAARPATAVRYALRTAQSAPSDPVDVTVACAGQNNGPVQNGGAQPVTSNPTAGQPAASGSQSSLPNTGAQRGLAALLGIGIGLLGVGVMLVRGRRRHS